MGQMKKLYTDLVLKAMNQVLDDVVAERWRQVEIHGHQEEKGTDHWLQVLMEEVGEVATALQNGDNENLYEELTQVAATAVKFAEFVKGYKH